jgi:hypothetical protein
MGSGESQTIILFESRAMNRTLRRRQMRSCSFRKRGGGFSVQNPLVSFNPVNDTDFSIKVPINQSYSDCGSFMRPGQLVTSPNPALAQTVMAGGASGCSVPRWGGRRTSRKGTSRKGTRRAKAQMGGFARAFAVDPSISVGGTGPNVGALYAPVACDARAGVHPGPMLPADPRAPANLYSATPNQTGGAYSTGNAYGAECYKAPGSSLPVYEAQTAGFSFNPSSASGAFLPDGVTDFNEVVPMAARVGGSRRRKARSGRKHRKASRRHRK